MDISPEHTASGDVPVTTWAGCAAALGLTPSQAGAMLTLINGFKEAFTTLMARPSAEGGPSPLDHIAAGLSARLQPGLAWGQQPMALHEAYSEFLDYTQTARPENEKEKDTYAVLLDRRRNIQVGKMEDLLDRQQRALFRVSVAPHLLELPTGVDPFGAALAARVTPSAAPATDTPLEAESSEEETNSIYGNWDVIAQVHQAAEEADFSLLVQALKLDEEQEGAFREVLHGLKDEVARLMGQPDSRGASPAAFLARAMLRFGGADEPRVKRDLMNYLSTTGPEGSERSFHHYFVDAEEKAHATLLALLRPEQRAAFQLVPCGSLPGIRTGYEPVGALVAEHTARLRKDEAPPEQGRKGMKWTDFVAALSLDAEQEKALGQLCKRLKDEFNLLFDAPTLEKAPSPLSILREASAKGLSEEAAFRRFQDYAATNRHHLLRRPYPEIFAQVESEMRGAMLRKLSVEQQRRFKALPLDSLIQLEWEEAPPEVGVLDGSDFEAALEHHANELKDRALALYTQPGAHGKPSPFAVLREALQTSPATAQQRFQHYIHREKPDNSAKTYGRLLATLEGRSREALLEKAPSTQRDAWRKALPPLLLSLETGYNPLLEKLKEALGATADGHMPGS